MKLTPVESSHIAAIGYLEDERVLLVRYKDGALYAQIGWSQSDYDILLKSESKGQFIALGGAGTKHVKISKGVMPTESETGSTVSVAVPGDNAAPSPGPLNKQRSHMQDAERVPQDQLAIIHGDNVLPTRLAESLGIAPLNVIDGDAGKCCRKAFESVRRAEPTTGCNVFNCPDCGTTFRPEMVGTNRFWRVVPSFLIHRR